MRTEHAVSEEQTPSTAGDETARRAVVVTGASSGIGRATAKRLARAGHLVVLAARRTEVCEKLAARLRGEGATAFAAHLDLADTSSIDTFVEAANYLVGTVDVLVSNAGASRPLLSTRADPATMRSIFDTNMLGAQHLTAQLLPAMIDKGGGDLIYVSSEVVGEAPRPRLGAYSASKHALEAWVAVLQAELEGTGVRASIVRPGHTLTNYTEDWNSAELQEMFDVWQRHGIMRHWNLLEPDDVAQVVASVISCPERMHLRLVEVMPSAPRTVEAIN
jgi:NADP-dependent 3-hydroxy acid dehydrogenase YdfG